MQQDNRGMHIFFLEFILVTILFVLTTAVLVVAFVKASTLSEQSANELLAMQQSISLLESKKKVLGEEDTRYLYAYDEAWTPVTESGYYHIVIEESLITKPNGLMQQLALRSYCTVDNKTLFETTVTTYLPGFMIQEEVYRDAD